MVQWIQEKRTGFTLFELLVVLVLISLIMSFVGPRLIKSLNRRNIESTARQIAASLRHARSVAVAEKVPYRALFDMDADELIIERHTSAVAHDSDPAVGPHEKPKVFKLMPGIRFNKALLLDGETVDRGIYKILFYPAGGTSGGEIILMDEENRSFCIAVDVITGMVKVNREDSADA